MYVMEYISGWVLPSLMIRRQIFTLFSESTWLKVTVCRSFSSSSPTSLRQYDWQSFVLLTSAVSSLLSPDSFDPTFILLSCSSWDGESTGPGVEGCRLIERTRVNIPLGSHLPSRSHPTPSYSTPSKIENTVTLSSNLFPFIRLIPLSTFPYVLGW